MKFHGHSLHSHHAVSVLTRNSSLRQLLLTSIAISGVLWLSTFEYSVRLREMPTPASGEVLAPPGMHWPSSGLEAQIVVEKPSLNINVEAFNRRREKDVADASRKLLSLAIALQSELNSNSDNKFSAMQKAKEIEKLARHVKDEMALNPLPL